MTPNVRWIAIVLISFLSCTKPRSSPAPDTATRCRFPGLHPPKGEAWDRWSSLLRQRFEHATLSLGTAYAETIGPGSCAVLTLPGDGLRAGVSPSSSAVFGEITIEIHELTGGEDGYSALQHLAPDTEKCLNHARSFIQFDGYWIQVVSECPDRGLYAYDVADVLAMLRAKDPSRMPTTFAFGGCSRAPVFRNVGEFMQSLTKPVTISDRIFPDAREAERKVLVEAKRSEQERRRRAPPAPILD